MQSLEYDFQKEKLKNEQINKQLNLLKEKTKKLFKETNEKNTTFLNPPKTSTCVPFHQDLIESSTQSFPYVDLITQTGTHSFEFIFDWIK